MSRFTQLICALLLAVGVAAPVRAQDTAVSIFDFYNVSQDKQWEWLSRGMADMLITDLSSAERLQVVDREGLQQYLDEFELQGGGVLNDQTLIDIGKLAGVDKVIFGTFQVDSTDNIVIQATLVDISSRKAETVVKVSGAVEDVLDLEKDLARRLIRDFGVPLSDREKRNLAFAWTESLDATAHFYTALGHYDQGELPLALAESRVAERIDPDYLPARFWNGRLYLELAEYEHAELYLTRLLREAGERPYERAYVVHSSLLLAQLYEKFLETPNKAIPVLEALRRDKLDSLERANIHFQLARLYRQAGQYTDAYHLFVSLYKMTDEVSLTRKFRIPYRSVALFPTLHKLRKMAIENYQSSYLLAYYNFETPPEPQPEMVFLTAEQPEYSRTETFQGYFSYAADMPRPMFIAPKGQRFRAFTFEFRGKQKDISIFPLLHQNLRFDLIGQKSSLPDPEGGVSQFRYEANQEMVQAFFFDASLRDQPEGKFSWRVKAEFMDANAFQPGSVEYWHGLLKENVSYPLLFDTPGHKGEKTTLAEGYGGQLWAVYDTQDEEEQNDRGKDSDLWLIASPDKKSWRGPQRLVAVNSVANDFDPVLIQDGRSRLVLTFASDRSGKNELWLAMSNDGDRWQRPRRVVMQDDNGKELQDLITPVVFQDRKGIYRLAAFHTATQRVLISSSKDLLNWEPAAFIELSDMHPAGGWGEKVTLDYIEGNDGIYRMIVSGNFFFDSKVYLGTSKNARDWHVETAEFDGYSHPSLIQANDGRFMLMLSSGPDQTISEYPIHYASQLSSRNWKTWDAPTSLPRIHYLADYYMKPSTIFQDREGSYWIANHRHWGEQFQLYRLGEFPATTIPQTFPAKPGAHPYARAQLRREELELEARLDGNKELAMCLSNARHYQSCLDEQSVSAEKEWWKFW
jgi:TolB-like protein